MNFYFPFTQYGVQAMMDALMLFCKSIPFIGNQDKALN